LRCVDECLRSVDNWRVFARAVGVGLITVITGASLLSHNHRSNNTGEMKIHLASYRRRNVALEIGICAVIALVGFCVTIAIVAVASTGIRREERRFSLLASSPDRLSRRARRLTGLYTRTPALTGNVSDRGANVLVPR